MKIFIYEELDRYGKPHYQQVELSQEEAVEWVNVDYERRLESAEPGVNVEKRTAQQIQDEIDREFINSDRRDNYNKALYQECEDDEGKSISIIELKASNELTSEERLIEEEKDTALKERIGQALSILTEKQRQRIIKRYVNEMTLQKIANEEHADVSSIKESIDAGLKKIKNKFKNTPKN